MASAIAFALAWLASTALASDCTNTSIGELAINDLAGGLYLGQFEGGLYPGGVNTMPVAHSDEGAVRDLAIVPRNLAGAPDADGSIVLLAVGYSITSQEFCTAAGPPPCETWSFVGQALADPEVDSTHLRLVNGARPGEGLPRWDSPSDPNYDRVRDLDLVPQGLSEAQVQAAWVKVTTGFPSLSLPDPSAEAYALVAGLADVVRAMKTRYLNLQTVFLSSRSYAGYADVPIHPEPFAYESAFGVKWLIEAQIDQAAGKGIDPLAGDLDYETVAPWLVWGPYLWADGVVARSDGLTWACDEFEADGTHPSQSGETKAAALLLAELVQSPFAASWLRNLLIFADDFEAGDTASWSATVP